MIEIIVASTLSLVTSYHIGNSLMQDGLGNKVGTHETGTYGIEALGRALGHDYKMSMHLDSGETLTGIWQNPHPVELIARGPYYGFDNALPNYHWDHVIMEPFWDDFSQSIPTIDSFIQMTRGYQANVDTVFYVYQVWPHRKKGDLTAYWESPAAIEDDSTWVAKRDYYAEMMDRLHETYDGEDIDVRLIPIGEVFHRVDLMIKAGELPGIELDGGIYRDRAHCSLDLGRYLAAGTAVSTMFQESLEGIPVPAQFQQRQFPQEVFDKLNEVIWDVVTSDPNTGVIIEPDDPPDDPPFVPLEDRMDFNGDGWVDEEDLVVWQEGYALGEFDGRDFLRWQRSYGLSTTEEIRAIPEPHVGVMVVLATLLCFSRRSR